MVVDEQEFRSFIANLVFIQAIHNKWINEEAYDIAQMKVENQTLKYIQMLETPKPSKWKQLKLIEHDKINN